MINTGAGIADHGGYKWLQITYFLLLCHHYSAVFGLQHCVDMGWGKELQRL